MSDQSQIVIEDGHLYLTNSPSKPKTFSVKCSTLHKDGLVVLKGHPCKIKELSEDNGMIHLIGTDLFTLETYDDTIPAGQNVEVPHLYYEDFMLIYVSDDNYVGLQGEDGTVSDDLRLPIGKFAESVRAAANKEGEQYICTVMTACEMKGVVALKLNTNVQQED